MIKKIKSYRTVLRMHRRGRGWVGGLGGGARCALVKNQINTGIIIYARLSMSYNLRIVNCC